MGGDGGPTIRGRIRLAFAGALTACVLCWCGAAQANQLTTITIPDRQGEIPSESLSYPGPPRAGVLLPDNYDRHKSYPLIVVLPGFGNTYSILGPGQLDAEKLLAGVKAIVVSPEGATGWYADWSNNGAYGTPQWESYILDEVLPRIQNRYKILPQRRYHALFGISMGGLGAAYLGGRVPDFFGSVGVLSGFVDLANPGAALIDTLTGAPPGSILGPHDGFYAAGHNPTALADNLRHTRVFLSTGDGSPTPGHSAGSFLDTAQEAGVIRPMSDAYGAALDAAGIDLTYQIHPGCHCWPDFQDEIRSAIAWGPFKRVAEHPTKWINSTVATHGRLWGIGYRFKTHPTAVVRFVRKGKKLRISAAGSSVALTMSRGCVVRTQTPANLRIPPKKCVKRRPGARR